MGERGGEEPELCPLEITTGRCATMVAAAAVVLMKDAL